MASASFLYFASLALISKLNSTHSDKVNKTQLVHQTFDGLPYNISPSITGF